MRVIGLSNEVGVLAVRLSRISLLVFLMNTSNSFNLSFSLVSVTTAVWNVAVCNKLSYLKKQRSCFVHLFIFVSRKVTLYIYLRMECYAHLYLLPSMYSWSRRVTNITSDPVMLYSDLNKRYDNQQLTLVHQMIIMFFLYPIQVSYFVLPLTLFLLTRVMVPKNNKCTRPTFSRQYCSSRYTHA